MRKTPELVIARVPVAVKAAVTQLAALRYDENESMALRHLLERGLRDLEREEQQQVKQTA